MVLKSFHARVDEEELMDLPETSQADFDRALQDIRWVNRRLNGAGCLIMGIEQLLSQKPAALRILDMGAGSADLPIAMVNWGQRVGIDVQVVAVDYHPFSIAAAARLVENIPAITLRQANILSL